MLPVFGTPTRVDTPGPNLCPNIASVAPAPPPTEFSATSHETDTRVTVYENVASGIGPHGRFRIEGAKWQLLKTLSSPRFGTAFIPTLMSEIEWQLLAETRANHMSYTWPVLRAAQGLFKATSFQGGSMVSSPPFFDSAGRGQLTF